MPAIIQLIIPLCLFAYFIFKSIQSKESISYILLIPLLFVLGRSIFIDIYNYNFRLFGGVIPISHEDILFLLTLFVWSYIKKYRCNPAKLDLKYGEILLILFLLLLILQFVLSIARGSEPYYVVGMGRVYFYIPLGYFLWIDILKRFTHDELLLQFKLLSWITVAITILYIFSAIGFNIYPYEPYHKFDYNGTKIVRDFATFPIWNGLALIYFLTLYKKNYLHLIAMCILIIGIFFTFTRSLLIAAGIVVLLYLITTKLQKRKNGNVINFISVSIIIMIALFILINYFNDYMDYLSNRFLEIEYNGFYETNLFTRFQMLSHINKILQDTDPLFGLGFLKEKLEYYKSDMILGDMQWAIALFFFGYLGIILVAIINLNALKNSFNLLVGKKNKKNQFSRILFLQILSLTLMSFIGSGIFQFCSISMFFYSLIMIEKRNLCVDIPINRFNHNAFINLNLQSHNITKLCKAIIILSIIVFFSFILAKYFII